MGPCLACGETGYLFGPSKPPNYPQSDKVALQAKFPLWLAVTTNCVDPTLEIPADVPFFARGDLRPQQLDSSCSRAPHDFSLALNEEPVDSLFVSIRMCMAGPYNRTIQSGPMNQGFHVGGVILKSMQL